MYYIDRGGAASMRIDELYWDDNNVDHLLASHYVTTDEIEEALLGDDEVPARYLVRRLGDAYELLGETATGRLLRMVGEFLADGRFRVFHARDMEARERRRFRMGKWFTRWQP